MNQNLRVLIGLKKKILDNNRYVIEDVPGFQVSSIRYEGVFDPLNMRLYKTDFNENNRTEKDDNNVDYLDSEDEI